MARFVLAVSLVHLGFFAGYVKLGVIKPWDNSGPTFSDGFSVSTQSVVMLLSFAAAPFLLGFILWNIDTLFLRRPSVWLARVRGAGFAVLGMLGLLGLGNGLIRGEFLERTILVPLIGFANDHLSLTVSLVFLVASGSFAALAGIDSLRKPVVGFIRTLLLILAPISLFSISGVFYLLADHLNDRPLPNDSAPPETYESLKLGGFPDNVVILLFDGLSYTTAFSKDGRVQEGLPNLRSLAQQSVVFKNDRSFRPGTTARNIPILLTGKVLYESHFEANVNVDVGSLADGTEVVLAGRRNIFDLLRGRGYRLSVFGMVVDYCGTYVTNKGACEFIPFYDVLLPPISNREAFLAPYGFALEHVLPGALERRLSGLPGMRHTDKTIGIWTRELQGAVLNSLQDDGGAAIYAHYPIPHGTWISYDGTTGQFGVGSGYFETYTTADALLGEIRQALELSGAWDKTLVILTSDHNEAGETSDPRVPLLIKLPYSQHRTDYDGLWTHAQFLPLLEQLLQIDTLDHEAVIQKLRVLAPAEKAP